MAISSFQTFVVIALASQYGVDAIFRIIYPHPWAPLVSNSITYRSKDPTKLENMQVAQFHSQDAAGRYVFGFNTPDQVRVEARSRDGKVRGSYSYVDPLGRTVKMEYWDNGDGFHMASSPKTDFNPYTPEVQAARDLHFRLYKEAAEAAAHIQRDTMSDVFQNTGHDDRNTLSINSYDDGKYHSSLEDDGKYHSSVEDEGNYHSDMDSDGKYHGSDEEEGEYHGTYDEHPDTPIEHYSSDGPLSSSNGDTGHYPYVHNESPAASPSDHGASEGGSYNKYGDASANYYGSNNNDEEDDGDSVVVNSSGYQNPVSRSSKSSIRDPSDDAPNVEEDQDRSSSSPKDRDQKVPVKVVPQVSATLVESSVGDNGFFYQFQHPVFPQLQTYATLKSPPESLHASLNGAIPIDAVHDSQVSPQQISQVQNHQLKPLFMILPAKSMVV